MVFAGLTDGSLRVWDLRESADLHPEAADAIPGGGRSPTFATAATDDNHPVPVLDIVTVGGTTSGVGRTSAAAFQVSSMMYNVIGVLGKP